MEFKEEEIKLQNKEYIEQILVNTDALDDGIKCGDLKQEQIKFQKLMKLNEKANEDPVTELPNIALYIPSIKPLPIDEVKESNLIGFYMCFAEAEDPEVFEPAAAIITYIIYYKPDIFAQIAIDAGYVGVIEKLIDFAESEEYPQSASSSIMRSLAALNKVEKSILPNYKQFFATMINYDDPLLQTICMECLEQITRDKESEDMSPMLFEINWEHENVKYIKCALKCLKNLAMHGTSLFNADLWKILIELDTGVYGQDLLSYLVIESTKSDSVCEIISNDLERFNPLFDVNAIKACDICLNIAGSEFSRNIPDSTIDILSSIYQEGSSDQKTEALKVLLQRILKLKPSVEELDDSVEIIVDGLHYSNRDIRILSLCCLNGLEYFSEEAIEEVGDMDDEDDPKVAQLIKLYLAKANEEDSDGD